MDWFGAEASNSTNDIRPFTYSFWQAYRNFVPANAPPADPSGLAASAPDFSSVLLTFTDASSDESHFQVQVSETGGGLNFVTLSPNISASTGTGTVEHRVTGLPSGRLRYFRVRAVNALGNSAWTSEVSATTVNYGRPPSNRRPRNFRPGF
jgi:hypothetical protein